MSVLLKAFCIIKRKDNEITAAGSKTPDAGFDTGDWYDEPTTALRVARVVDRLFWRFHSSRFESMSVGKPVKYAVSAYYNNIMRRDALRSGCRLIAPYGCVVTTRLHGMILAAMLGRRVRYIDNLTGKISSFADTWLAGYKDVFAPYDGSYSFLGIAGGLGKR